MSGGEGTLTIQAAEFQRLQTQLIDLRTTNYQLKEEQHKLTSEISQLKETLQSQSREIEKANKTLQKSKKAKEVSSLIEENDSLQQKLLAQEEDFNLQNRTVMVELNAVCEENETLKAQIKNAERGNGIGGGRENEQLLHLRAENIALQKSFQGLKERLFSRTAEEGDGLGSSAEQADTSPRVMELQLQLDTEREEKLLLTARLEEIQVVAKREQAQLQAQLDMWVDKAKKKQDSIVKLQEEKEKQYMENRAALDEVVRVTDHKIQSLEEQVQSLSRDLKSKDEMSSVGAEIAKQLESLSTEKEEFSLKCSVLAQEVESLARERDELKAVAGDLGRELHQSKAELGEQKTATEYLNTQLEEAKLSQERLADQVVQSSEDRQTKEEELKAALKLADKRKAILDELSIKGHVSAEELRKKNIEVQEKAMSEVKRLEQKLEEERAEVRRLGMVGDELSELKRKLKSLEEKQLLHDTTVSELEATHSEERAAHKEELEMLREKHEETTQSLQSELCSIRDEVEAGRERVKELEVTIEDKEEKVRIVEKKSNAMLKDLKRQLQQMQRREERLQEQMTDMREGHTLEQIFSFSLAKEQTAEPTSRHSRESSLSSQRGLPGVEGAGGPGGPGGPGGTNCSPTSSLRSASGPRATASGMQFGSPVAEETRELLSRVTDLQKDKWILEEKVNHLETTGSALAEDVMQKSEIIKTYFMENKADHHPHRRTVADKMSPMRLVPWAKNKEDTLNEINRKMQRALEETLVKNIHLQENVEMLTAELEKYTTKKPLDHSLSDKTPPQSDDHPTPSPSAQALSERESAPGQVTDDKPPTVPELTVHRVT